MHKLVFTPENRKMFDTCYTALALNGNPPPVSEWPDYVAAMRAFRTAGVRTREEPELYGFNEPCSVCLERGEMKLLIARVKSPMWSPTVLEHVMDTVKFLETCADEQGVNP